MTEIIMHLAFGIWHLVIRCQMSEVGCQKITNNQMLNAKSGITLIALIITVIILLILAGTAISIAINGGDIFGKTNQARESWNAAVAEEQTEVNYIMSLLDYETGGDGST